MADVAAVMARLRAEVAKACKAMTMEVTANLRDACPVDTGHARANIIPSVAVPHATEITGTSEGDHDAGIAAVLKFKIGDGDLFVTNHVPYWGRLVGGSSDQAPPGWDLVAIAKAAQSIQARHNGIKIDVTSDAASKRGGFAAENVASAFSPFGGDDW